MWIIQDKGNGRFGFVDAPADYELLPNEVAAPSGFKPGMVSDDNWQTCRWPTTAELMAEEKKEISNQLLLAVEEHMDATAKEKGYDTRYTCAVRAGYVNQWRAEGQAFGEWMDSCYAYLYQVEADVNAGTRAIPTEEELIAELPPMVWP